MQAHAMPARLARKTCHCRRRRGRAKAMPGRGSVRYSPRQRATSRLFQDRPLRIPRMSATNARRQCGGVRLRPQIRIAIDIRIVPGMRIAGAVLEQTVVQIVEKAHGEFAPRRRA